MFSNRFEHYKKEITRTILSANIVATAFSELFDFSFFSRHDLIQLRRKLVITEKKFADSIIAKGTYLRKRIYTVVNRIYRQRLYFK